MLHHTYPDEQLLNICYWFYFATDDHGRPNQRAESGPDGRKIGRRQKNNDLGCLALCWVLPYLVGPTDKLRQNRHTIDCIMWFSKRSSTSRYLSVKQSCNQSVMIKSDIFSNLDQSKLQPKLVLAGTMSTKQPCPPSWVSAPPWCAWVAPDFSVLSHPRPPPHHLHHRHHQRRLLVVSWVSLPPQTTCTAR